jgi:dCMP deaminase
MPLQLLAFMPVIHRGYEQVLAKLGPGAQVLLLGASFGDQHPVVRKEIRALAPDRVAEYLAAGFPQLSVRVVEKSDLVEAVTGPVLVVPDERLMHEIVEAYDLGSRADIRFERTFLRWDRDWAELQNPVDIFPRYADSDDVMRLARKVAKLSTSSGDWWRQVGAIAVRRGRILVTGVNEHMPSDYSPYVIGDPRNEYRKGDRADLSTALHAEAAVVAKAARSRVQLEGADLFVTTFPCPQCARLIAATGFARCFYTSGYSVLNGAEVLEAAGVELHYVDVQPGQLALPEVQP